MILARQHRFSTTLIVSKTLIQVYSPHRNSKQSLDKTNRQRFSSSEIVQIKGQVSKMVHPFTLSNKDGLEMPQLILFYQDPFRQQELHFFYAPRILSSSSDSLASNFLEFYCLYILVDCLLNKQEYLFPSLTSY